MHNKIENRVFWFCYNDDKQIAEKKIHIPVSAGISLITI